LDVADRRFGLLLGDDSEKVVAPLFSLGAISAEKTLAKFFFAVSEWSRQCEWVWFCSFHSAVVICHHFAGL
jgi:hypothetical protein